MTEEQLAIFDLLTKPGPVLTDEEWERVKAGAKDLLEHLHEVIVQDWHRKADVVSEVDSTIRRILDQSLPAPYTVDIFQSKVQLVLDHVLTAYGDNQESAYTPRVDFAYSDTIQEELDGSFDVNKIADDVVARIQTDPAFAVQVARQLRAASPTGGDLA